MEENDYTTQFLTEKAIERVKNEYEAGREVSLVITKLEEALLWLSKAKLK